MSDTSSFLAGCATTGMAALLLVLARVTLDESPPVVQSRVPNSGETEILAPIPVPPPPTPQDLPEGDSSDTRDRREQQLQREIDRQQTLAQRLEDQLEDQELLIRDLENKVERQETDRVDLLARLDDQQRSLDVISDQQRRLSNLDGQPKDAQTIVVWVGAGFFIAIIGAGGITLIGILIMMSQAPRRTPRNSAAPLMYPPAPMPPPYRYYEQEFLPPPQLRPSRRMSSYPDEYDL
ncbi:MAG: hypothetical protein AAF215_30695 [Cyanobacteria bacterium P01_A01_bin.123]